LVGPSSTFTRLARSGEKALAAGKEMFIGLPAREKEQVRAAAATVHG
jgi:hypothetical protein